jgi:hypothetical protein
MRRKHPRQTSSGIALVEFIVVIPILLLLLVASIEFGRVFHQYMILSNTAAVAVRTGVQLGGLGEVCFEDDAVQDLAYQSTQPSNPLVLSHWFAQRRANVILYTLRNSLLVTGTGQGQSPNISSEFIRNPLIESSASAACSTTLASDEAHRTAIKDTFAVRIEGSYKPLLFPISFPLRVESRSSYLFSNSNYGVTGGAPCRPKKVT